MSLILQYKRPECITRSNGRQWHLWGHDYFRFEVTDHQHEILTILEGQLDREATVRYASAAFSGYTTLQDYQMAREVLTRSAFALPSQIGHHTVWTYDSAGTIGQGNPNGEPVKLESFGVIWERLPREREGVTLLEHLRQLAAGVEKIQPIVVSNVGPPVLFDDIEPKLTDEQRQGVLDILVISDLVTSHGSTWFVVDLDST